MSTVLPEDQLDPKDPNVMDLGCGVLAKFYPLHDDASIKAGIIYEHPDGKGGRCWGGAPFEGVNPVDPRGWKVQSLDPLTLLPSLLCLTCRHHGFIRTGKWIPA